MTVPVDPNEVLMTGENSFVRLSPDGGKTQTERFSHWRVLWSPAGQGHVLFLETKSIRVLSDNAGMTRYLQKHIEKLLHEPFADPSLPIVDAKFERTGHSLATVEERVYQGISTVWIVRDRADERFVVYEQNDKPFEESSRFGVGSRLFVCWNPRHAVMMRREAGRA